MNKKQNNPKKIGYAILCLPLILAYLYISASVINSILGNKIGYVMLAFIMFSDETISKLLSHDNILINTLVFIIPLFFIAVWLLSAFAFFLYGDRRRKTALKSLASVLIAFPLYNIVPLIVCKELRAAPYLGLNIFSLCAGTVIFMRLAALKHRPVNFSRTRPGD